MKVTQDRLQIQCRNGVKHKFPTELGRAGPGNDWHFPANRFLRIDIAILLSANAGAHEENDGVQNGNIDVVNRCQ